MKKAFRKIHLWLSVPFGLIITVICFSGAALVFEDEVMELCRRDLYYVEKVSGAPLPVEYLIEKVPKHCRTVLLLQASPSLPIRNVPVGSVCRNRGGHPFM